MNVQHGGWKGVVQRHGLMFFKWRVNIISMNVMNVTIICINT